MIVLDAAAMVGALRQLGNLAADAGSHLRGDRARSKLRSRIVSGRRLRPDPSPALVFGAA